MRSSIGSPKARDLERFRRLQDLGAIDVILRGGPMGTPGDIHHLLDGGRRISHQHTICLTPWAHRGLPPDGYSTLSATETFGPSKAHNPRAFAEFYATDAELLEATELMLRAYSKVRPAA